MAALIVARLTVAAIPFDRWRRRLGRNGHASEDDIKRAKRLAAHVDWAARLLPFPTKCLPRAMALSWVLRRNQIAHAVVLAARPANFRQPADALHAWVEVGEEKVIGDLPGPWVETLRGTGIG